MAFFTGDVWSQTLLYPKPKHLQSSPVNGEVYLDPSMVQHHPHLTFLSLEMERARCTTDAERGRAVALVFSGEAPQPCYFQDSGNLKTYLENTKSDGLSRLYILEDIATNYVEIFGKWFNIDPIIFARQLRNTNWEDNGKASQTPVLPSGFSKGAFCLRYPEVVRFLGPELQKTEQLFCYSNVYRPIRMMSLNSFYDGVGIICRKVSFWSQNCSDGSWNGKPCA